MYDKEDVANFSAGIPILIRNPRRGWSKVYSARRSYKGVLYIDGYLPTISEGDTIFAQAVIQDAEAATSLDLTVWAPALRAEKEALQWLIRRVVPSTMKVNLTLLQQSWGHLYCTWGQSGACSWHSAIPGLSWESANDLIWHFNSAKWDDI